MDCSLIKDPGWLTETLRSGEPVAETRVINCFIDVYYDFWCRLANSYLQKNWEMPDSRKEEMARDAFYDGLWSFILHIRKKGFIEKEATLQTFFFKFCINKLKGALKKEKSHNSRFKSIDPETWNTKAELADEVDFQAIDERKLKEEKEQRIWEKAWSMLNEKCKDLIVWRKYYKWSNEQIAGLADMGLGTVNNAVYRCVKNLKDIVDNLKAE